MSKTRQMIGVTLMLVGMMVMTAGVAVASHVNDGGVDQAWTNDMNQETYWENLWGAECTQFENHSGSIPAGYDAAVVKDGNFVRVYNPAPVPFTAIGAVNPANGKHFDPPHSWVMKCKTTQTSTTTTLADTTTTAEVTSTTTSSSTTTTLSDLETTTTSASTTSTTGSPTSTDPSGSPTTTSLPAPTSTVPSRPTELPFTGILALLPLGVLGAGLVVAGIRLIRREN